MPKGQVHGVGVVLVKNELRTELRRLATSSSTASSILSCPAAVNTAKMFERENYLLHQFLFYSR